MALISDTRCMSSFFAAGWLLLRAPTPTSRSLRFRSWQSQNSHLTQIDPVVFEKFLAGAAAVSFLASLWYGGVSFIGFHTAAPAVWQSSLRILDAAVQTNPPGDVFQDVSTQTSDQQDTLSCDVAVQTSSHGIHMLPRRRPHQYFVSAACLYADGLSLSFLVFC